MSGPVAEVKERPILFSAPMVRAILDGSKTQTRRAIKPQPAVVKVDDRGRNIPMRHPPYESFAMMCPYGWRGHRLWVRENLRFDPDAGWCYDAGPWASSIRKREAIHAQLDRVDFSYSRPVCPSIHMPRKACRIVLEITEVRAERLHDISPEDAIAEGIERRGEGWKPYVDGSLEHFAYPQNSYFTLWESINGRESADSNPWVWVVAFKRVTA